MAIVVLFLVTGGIVYGDMASRREWFPISVLNQIRIALRYNPEEVIRRPFSTGGVDEAGRLAAYPGKVEIDCPRQTPATAVIFVIGQSNSENYGGQRFVTEYGDRVANFFNGKCYLASSPLLGTSGQGGESFTLLGNKLIQGKHFDRVILVHGGAGAPIASYQKDGNNNKVMQEAITSAIRTYTITHIIFIQGEADYVMKTNEEDYLLYLRSLVRSTRESKVEAPFFVTVATKCGLPWQANSPVAKAQVNSQDASLGIVKGVDTDSLILDVDRYDGCHFGHTGQGKFASAMRDLLVRH